MSLEDGAQHYSYSRNYFRKLVKRSGVPTLNILRAVHFSVEAFDRFLEGPEGHKSLDEAAEDSIFVRDTIRKLLERGKVKGEKKHLGWYVSMNSLKEYEASHKGKSKGNGTNTNSIDGLVNSI